MTRTLSLGWFLLTGMLVACGTSSTAVDSGPANDAGRMDAGVGSDGGRMDAGQVDSGAPADSGPDSVDAARPDAGMCMDPEPGDGRPAAWECSPCRPPGPGGVGSGACMEDADCVDGANGRCMYARMGGTCSYDECFKDDDCAAGELCACDGGFGGGNACIEAGCHTDADCGAFTCAPTLGTCGDYFPPVGYFCHSAADACQSDADCGPGYCARNDTTGLWACSTARCVG